MSAIRRLTHSHYFSWCLWGLVILSLMILFPTLAHADNGVVLSDDSNGAMFTPSASDQSIIYLGELFGSIPPVLAGTGSSIMGDLFKIFNTAALSLGIIIAGYTTFVGIMNTAGEGEMLGKNWNSIWIPMRSVAGIALLIPTASGYCVCQIFMMWLLVQGIGAADTLTSKVVDYMYSGQKVFVAGDTGDTNSELDYSKYDTLTSSSGASGSMITSILQGLTCMQAYQKDNADTTNFVSPPSPVRDNESSPTKLTYNFIANVSATETISCGSVVVTGDKDNPINSITAPYIEQGYAAIMPSLNAVAYFMVNSTAGSVTTTAADGTTTSTSPVEDDVLQETFNFVGSDYLTEVEKTYQSYVTQAQNAEATQKPTIFSNNNGDTYDSVRAYGWAALGSLYWDLAQSYSTSGSVAYNNGWSSDTGTYIGSFTDVGVCAGTYSSSACKFAAGGPDGWALQFVNDLVKTRKDGSNSSGLVTDFNSGNFNSTGVVGQLSLDILETLHNKFQDHRNPMIIAQELGHDITYQIEATFTALQVVMAAAGVAMSAVALGTSGGSFITAPSGIDIVLGMIALISSIFAAILPGIFAFMAAMLTLGGTLAIVVPFIPVLAYSLAVIAWLIAALETIVAAPIVAIGVLHPDGQHHMWGKAEPAIMLMINMFLRPSLLVIGFIAGIILSSISIQFVNLGFFAAVDNIVGDSDGGTVSGIEAMLLITTYVAIILACVNQSFSVIEALPNTILRWIGGENARFQSGSDAMQKIQGSQESSAQKSSDSATQAAEGSTNTPEKVGAAASKARHAIEEDGGQGMTSQGGMIPKEH